VARVTDPFGNLLGVIENPHFSLEAMKLIHWREEQQQ